MDQKLATQAEVDLFEPGLVKAHPEWFGFLSVEEWPLILANAPPPRDR